MPKKIVAEGIEDIRDELISLSKKIHANPELSFNEYNAVENITYMLERHGFIVDRGISGLDTAFRGEYKGKGTGPKLAFIAEYDAPKYF